MANKSNTKYYLWGAVNLVLLHFELFVESTKLKEVNAIAVVEDFSKPPHHTHCLHPPHPLEEKNVKV